MAPKWYGDYTDGTGVRRRVALVKDKSASLSMLADLERKADRARAGLTDRFEEWRKVPLSNHLDDWKRSLESQGVADGGSLTTNRARWLLDESKAAFLGDLVPSRLVDALERLAKREDFSLQTQNFYLGSIKQFARWLESDGRIEANPLRHLKGKNVALDRRHDRRAFSQEEAAWLLQATRKAQTRAGLTGEDRFWLYRTALATGLRAGELGSLKREAFDDGFVVLGAKQTKNRREACQPLPKALWEKIQGWLQGKPKGEPVWPGNWVKNRSAGKSLREDLLEARQAWLAQGGNPEADTLLWEDSKGLFGDFHALRHTAITWAEQTGATVKTLQTLARHSTATLTMDKYAKAPKAFDLIGLVERIPDPTTLPLEAIAPINLQTGTESTVPSTVPSLCLKDDIQRQRMSVNDKPGRLGEGFSNPLKQVVSSRKQAEGEGFEPTDALRHLRFSRPVEDCHKPLLDKGIGKTPKSTVPSTVSSLPKDLQEIVKVWDQLPQGVRSGIMAMIKALA